MGRSSIHRRLFGGVATAAVLVLAACTPLAPPPPPPASTAVSCSAGDAAATGEQSASMSQTQAAAEAEQEFNEAPARQPDGDVELVTVERVGDNLDVSTTEVSSSDEAATVAAEAAQGNDLVSVEAAQPVQALEAGGPSATSVSNDSYRVQQWALDKAAFESAWATTDGTGATVAVVDTGVQADHPDLTGQVLPGYEHWGTHDGDMDPAYDDNGHGTHVAGIIAAIANNSAGVAGAAPGVEILPVKVLNSNGSGSSADVAFGINWAVANGADVINLSLGGSSSSSIRAAVDNAVANGVLVFAAAGNSGSGGAPSYPGADANAIGVASVTSSLVRSSFSTTGSYVDIAAPGSSIKSTYKDSSYATLSGTSMATPYAAAEGALIVAAHPALNVSELRERLLTTANDLGASGRDSSYGCGFIDPLEAVS